MTNEFRELSNRLAQGMNFDKGSVLLITCMGDIDSGKVFMKGNTGAIAVGVCGVLELVLQRADDDKFAATIRQMVIETIIADEERRFQKGETE